MNQTRGPLYLMGNKISDSPLCSGYEDGRIVVKRGMEPRNQITMTDVCPFNNECKDNSQYQYLNQRGVKPSPFFQESSKPGEFLKKTYVSDVYDSRLVDAGRGGFVQTLDSKPLQVYYDLIHDNISQNPELDNYGLGYKGYSTVNAGELQYYIDQELAQPFSSPAFGLPSESYGYEWTDPMGSRKPEYVKTYPRKPTLCLSWLQDSQSQREDVMSLQQNLYNRTRYDTFFAK